MEERVTRAADSDVARSAGNGDVPILCEVCNHVAFITLNRPPALNALSIGMLEDLHDVLQACAADSEVRAVLLRGAGGRAFCAGGDIRSLYQSVKESGTLHCEFFLLEYRLDHALYSYPKPFVALLDGITMGGGMGLSQASRLRVVGERTRIAMPEVGIGLFPDVGASHFLSRLPGALGMYLGLTGAQIRGPDAVYAGLADLYLSPAAIDALPEDIAGLQWTDNGTADVGRFLKARATAKLPAASLAPLRPAIDEHFSCDSVAAILSSLDGEVRADYRPWAAETAKLMRTRSPTMMCVTLSQLRRGANMTLADCFRMETGMVQHSFEHGDLIEGIRALLIDKDNAPRWNPARLEEVTEAIVSGYFKDPWGGGTHPLADLETRPLFTRRGSGHHGN